MKNSDMFEELSNQLREALSVVLPTANLAQKLNLEDNESKEKIKEYIKIISKSSYNMLRTIENAADFKAIEENKLEMDYVSCDVSVFCRELIAEIRESNKNKKVFLNFSEPLNTKISFIDVEKTERIILNIISNSILNTKEGATIDISLEYESSYWVLKVSDNGAAIDEGTSKKIFSENIRRDIESPRYFGGIGMGLAIAHNFARLQDGELKVDFENENGCKFVLKMPYLQNKNKSKGFNRIVPEFCDYNFEQRVLEELSYFEL
ncbi:MAG: HAMP domain-containing histidine kinase [Ruminococcaceae bacterium]|nr:HAMP domain-containing histidine kinase [Oscillospiraceae bacterium]